MRPEGSRQVGCRARLTEARRANNVSFPSALAVARYGSARLGARLSTVRARWAPGSRRSPERVLRRENGGGCLLGVAARMPGLTLTETETFACEFQNMTGMGEPVKQRPQEPGILKDLCPLAEMSLIK